MNFFSYPEQVDARILNQPVTLQTGEFNLVESTDTQQQYAVLKKLWDEKLTTSSPWMLG